MVELLRELSADPRANRRRVALGLGAAAMLIGAVVGTYSLTGAPATPCTGAAQKLAGTWDDSAKKRIQEAFVVTGAPHAPDTFQRVEKQLNAWTEEWIAHYTEACQATRIQRDQSEEVLDLRMHCLRRKFGSLDSLVGILGGNPDSRVVDKAVEASVGLGRLEFCGDVEALKQEVRPPEDPIVRQRVEALGARLEDVRQHDKLGNYKEAATILAEVRPQAESVDYPPLETELLYLEGVRHQRLGEYDKAEDSLSEALVSGLQRKQPRLALSAALKLVYVVGYELHRHAEGIAFSKTALGLSRGLGEEAEADAIHGLANLLLRKGEYRAAEVEYRHALAIKEKAVGLEHPTVAKSRHNLGTVLSRQGRYEEAEQEFRRALALLRKALGPEHPFVAVARVSLGIALARQGAYAKAEAEYQHALAQYERTFGPEHLRVALTRDSLGNVLRRQSRYEEAEAQFRRAAAMIQKVLGPEHPSLALTKANLADALLRQGMFEQSEAEYRRALAVREMSDPNHPDVAIMMSGLGDLLWNTERYREATLQYERALRVCGERICHPESRARAEFGMAKAYWRAGKEKTRAMDLAKSARLGFAKIHMGSELAQVGTWLEARGVMSKGE